jgi:uncharacterized membrane protein
MSLSTRLLIGGLLGLVALYVFWFNPQPVTMAIFAAPPLLLAALCWNGGNRPAFWAGLLALGWFSHGVMVSWSRPEDRQLANIEIVLSLLVVLAASLPGLRARFSKR